MKLLSLIAWAALLPLLTGYSDSVAGPPGSDPAPASLKKVEPRVVAPLGVPSLGDARPDNADVRRAIEAANDRWMAAFRRNDSKSMASVYASDASLIPPDEAIVEGRADIVSYFAAQRGLGMRNPFVKTLEVYTMGDVAYEVGTYGLRYDPGDEKPRTDSGRYFAIWKAQDDGTWRYHHGIWSRTSSRGSALDRRAAE